MRMFLVAMCDLFLLLYLTTLIQSGGRAASKLTVADYAQVKEAEQQAVQTVAQLSARLEQEIAEKQQLISRTSSVEEEAKSLRELRAKLEEKLEQASSETDLLSSRLAAISDQVEQSERQRREMDERAAQLAELLGEAEKQQQALALELEAQSLEYQKAVTAADAARTEAIRLAEQAERDRALAGQAAQTAQEEASMAQQQADLLAAQLDQARERAHQAALQIEKVEAERQQAQALATTASRVAESARSKAKQLTGELQSITQASDTAFEKQVEPRFVTVASTVVSKNIFGNLTKSYGSRGIPVKFKGFTVVFQFLPDLGLRSKERYSSVSLRVNNSEVDTLLISPDEQIAALVISDQRAAALQPAEVRSENLMPTLIAVRNDGKLGVWDRLREVEGNYFALQRDELRAAGNSRLVYELQGIRGTGDYAAQILPGDHLVDLNGALVGIADEKNSILLPHAVQWRQSTLRDAFMQRG
ncbi:MAG: hypothetical protein J5J00_01005 [Deltaproteobacteria bacterium]|nr:hypothetical protein [Deltaproteobacteria bacterium]